MARVTEFMAEEIIKQRTLKSPGKLLHKLEISGSYVILNNYNYTFNKSNQEVYIIEPLD